mmetsp:Transcript_29528/g.68439  ORF Transcript_29528/g.68439 Transcript_29528/m.68439 type:complete len:164 (-) Transcript_29528:155-646(-)
MVTHELRLPLPGDEPVTVPSPLAGGGAHPSTTPAEALGTPPISPGSDKDSPGSHIAARRVLLLKIEEIGSWGSPISNLGPASAAAALCRTSPGASPASTPTGSPRQMPPLSPQKPAEYKRDRPSLRVRIPDSELTRKHQQQQMARETSSRLDKAIDDLLSGIL